MSDLDSTNGAENVSTRPRTGPLHVWHDSPIAGSISTTVVTAAAQFAEVDPTAMPPLYDYIDPDALDRLVHGGTSGFEGYITFDYDGYSITVYGDGEIVVHDLDPR